MIQRLALDGNLVYAETLEMPGMRLGRLDGRGEETLIPTDSTNAAEARLSPDDQWVVFGTFPAGVARRSGQEAIEGATLSI